MLSECGRGSALDIQQYLQEMIISSDGILHQRVWLAGGNSNSTNTACVLAIVTICLKGKRKIHPNCGRKMFLQFDLDGSQDVPTEWKLIRRDIPEGV